MAGITLHAKVKGSVRCIVSGGAQLGALVRWTVKALAHFQVPCSQLIRRDVCIILSPKNRAVFFLLTSGRSHLLSSLVLIGFCRRSRSSSSGTWKMFDDLISGFITWSRWGNDLKINSMRRDNSFCCPKFQARSKERILHKVVYIQIILRRVYIVWVECLFGVLIL